MTATAKPMTPEEFHLIDKALNRNVIVVGDEYYDIPVGKSGTYYQSVSRYGEGEIERAERVFTYSNLCFRLDRLTYGEDGKLLLSETKPRPHFDTWQEYLKSLCLRQEIPDELKGVA